MILMIDAAHHFTTEMLKNGKKHVGRSLPETALGGRLHAGPKRAKLLRLPGSACALFQHANAFQQFDIAHPAYRTLAA